MAATRSIPTSSSSRYRCRHEAPNQLRRPTDIATVRAAISQKGGRMHFDTVIIGCGTTGSMLAADLSADPSRTVCAIEAGPDYPTSDEIPRHVFEYLAPPETTHDSAPNRLSTTSFLVNSPANWGYTARSTRLAPRINLPRGKLAGGSSAVNGCTWLWPVRQDLDAWVKAGNAGWEYEECLPYLAAIEDDTDFPADHHGSGGPIRVQRTPRSAW